MDDAKLMEYIDHCRFMMNHGLVTDNIKNQLFFYGSIVHQDVQAVELKLDMDNKKVYYQVYVTKKLLKKSNKYRKLSYAKSLLGLWRFKRYLAKEGNLNFNHLLNQFVKSFCGPKWSVDVDVVDYRHYKNGFGDEKGIDIDNSNDK